MTRNHNTGVGHPHGNVGTNPPNTKPVPVPKKPVVFKPEDFEREDGPIQWL